jgi:hypothetical protein
MDPHTSSTTSHFKLKLYPVTVNTALLPTNGSVPAPTLCRIWLLGNPCFPVKYLTNSIKSPLKLLIWLLATKLKTFYTRRNASLASPFRCVLCVQAEEREAHTILPFIPSYNFQLFPARVTVAIGCPDAEMGPAPPNAASQIMISYCADPVAVLDVNKSYATFATMPEPVYVYDHVDGSEEMAESAFWLTLVTTFAYDFTL